MPLPKTISPSRPPAVENSEPISPSSTVAASPRLQSPAPIQGPIDFFEPSRAPTEQPALQFAAAAGAPFQSLLAGVPPQTQPKSAKVTCHQAAWQARTDIERNIEELEDVTCCSTTANWVMRHFATHGFTKATSIADSRTRGVNNQAVIQAFHQDFISNREKRDATGRPCMHEPCVYRFSMAPDHHFVIHQYSIDEGNGWVDYAADIHQSFVGFYTLKQSYTNRELLMAGTIESPTFTGLVSRLNMLSILFDSPELSSRLEFQDCQMKLFGGLLLETEDPPTIPPWISLTKMSYKPD